MKTGAIRLLIFPLLAFMLSMQPVHAQDDAAMDEALKNCDRDQQTMNLCARHRYDSADQALNQTYRDSIKVQPSAAARQRLRDAQRAWIVYRDKDCLAETGPREEGGSIWPLAYLSCRERHTLRRTEDLKRQACGMGGCR
jgi:uncharacterized protein YecT (DUF1311 family)